jgi:hypothetical protein
MKLFLFSLLMNFLPTGFAQTNSLDRPLTPNELWRQDGQLLTVFVSRKNPIRIFVAGREEATFDPARLKLTVRRALPLPAKELHVDRFNNYYVVSPPQETKSVTDLEIITHVPDKKDEVFHFKLNQRKP